MTPPPWCLLVRPCRLFVRKITVLPEKMVFSYILSRGGYPGGERERDARGHSGVPRTNRGTDEVRYEHLASGRDNASHAQTVGPQWRTRSSVARESSAPQNTTKTMSCMAFPPMLVLTVVCSMLDNRVLAHRPTASHLGPNTHAPPTVHHHTGAEAGELSTDMGSTTN